MYQIAELDAGRLQPQHLRRLDFDRRKTHDEGETAGEEQAGQRRDERLDVEELDQYPDEQADQCAGEQDHR